MPADARFRARPRRIPPRRAAGRPCPLPRALPARLAGRGWPVRTTLGRVQRAARAGVFNYRAAAWDGGPRLPTKAKFDGVLVDAPCSGIGTWHRNPHARWTTTAEDVKELSEVQQRLLLHAAGAVKPGGKLVYAACTLAELETTRVVQGFEQRCPEFERLALSNPLAPKLPPSGPLFLWPQESGGNGMCVAAWVRTSV